ncbi:hypothetical protein AB0P17_11190 [Streptomyces sp. NPDC088124]|uniref:hypothetical protein n=1 Tax=Streptomyces sp. NPDC088124 TaxID=3154654 RepID=UPI003429404F
MHDALWLVGSAGGLLCLAGHLPAPARQWGPHAVALAAMLPMGLRAEEAGPLMAGAAAALAAACLWNARVGRSFRRGAEVVNLAMMALLAAVSILPRGQHGTGGHGGSAPVATEPWLALFFVGCWAVVRAAVVLVSQAWPAPGVPSGAPSRGLPGVAPARPGRRVALLRESGALLMVAAMAGMVEAA